MAKAPKPPRSELVVAAEALEEETVRIEGMSRSLRKIPLNADKSLARATEQLNETLALPERMGHKLQALAGAMTRLQERQQAALEPLAAFAVELQTRTRLLGEHMQTFAALGQSAGAVSAELAASAGDRAAIAHAEAELQALADRARSLFEAARSDDFPEISRQADVLKQRVAGLRKRLGQRA